MAMNAPPTDAEIEAMRAEEDSIANQLMEPDIQRIVSLVLSEKICVQIENADNFKIAITAMAIWARRGMAAWSNMQLEHTK